MTVQVIQRILGAGGCIDLNAKGYAVTFLEQFAKLARQHGGHLRLHGLQGFSEDFLVSFAAAGRSNVTIVLDD